jgi:hypothetical protein
VIGHSLAVAPRAFARATWDRWIAIGFGIGSACFFIGPFPGFGQLVGQGTDGVVFLAGSVFFTLAAGLEVSGLLAYRVATGPESTMAAVNLAGCVLFGISAVASYVVPSSGSVLDLAAVNWCTALGALCFFIGALMLLPRKSTVLKEA